MVTVLKFSIDDQGKTTIVTERTRVDENGTTNVEVKNPKTFRSKNIDACLKKYAKKFRIRSYQVVQA